MNYVTVPSVEIAHVGMDWQASTGTHTITMQHLADAVAAQQDPHILAPRLKVGHTDARFNEGDTVYDPFEYAGPVDGDGQPVYGRVENLRLTEDGMVLVGDYVGVPEWLGDALPSAYPSRSLEATWDVKTQGGKTYSFVVTAVALLGDPLPAITCLEDLQLMLAQGPAAVTAAQKARANVNARSDTMPKPVAAEASTDAVRGQFFDEFAVDDRYWWWPCEIRVESGWLLADDDEGHLYRVPFGTDNDGNVTFGDPVQGVLDFRETAQTEANEPVAASRGAVRFASATQAGRPMDRVRAATTTEEEHMAPIAPTAVLERLGLPEDATEADLLAALDNEQNENETETEAETTPAQLPVAASASTVTVDREQWEQTQRDARDGAAARAAQVQASREQFVDDAVQAGKFPPSRRSHYLGLMAADDVGARQLIDGLAAGLVPTEERGTAPAAETAPADLGWFPQYATTTQEGQ